MKSYSQGRGRAPTVALESVFVTAAIDARENREVVTIDIPGAFLHATNSFKFDCKSFRHDVITFGASERDFL